MEKIQYFIEYIFSHEYESLAFLTASISIIAILAVLGISIIFINTDKANKFYSFLVVIICLPATYYFYQKSTSEKLNYVKNKVSTKVLPLVKINHIENKVSPNIQPLVNPSDIESKVSTKVQLPVNPSENKKIIDASLLNVSQWKSTWREKAHIYNTTLKVPTPRGQIILPSPKLGIKEKPFNEKFIYHAKGYVLTTEGRFYISNYSFEALDKGKIKYPTWIYVKQ